MLLRHYTGHLTVAPDSSVGYLSIKQVVVHLNTSV